MNCNFCTGVAHPVTGCVYGRSTIACASCTREFWVWVIRHTNGKSSRRVRKDGTMRPETALSFYEAAALFPEPTPNQYLIRIEQLITQFGYSLSVATAIAVTLRRGVFWNVRRVSDRSDTRRPL